MGKFFIGPFQIGLQKDLKPWLLPNEAFSYLEDAYVWRGRVKKRTAYSFLGRLHLTPKVLPEPVGATIAPGIVYAGNLTYFPVSPGTVTITVGAGPGMRTFTDNLNPGGTAVPNGMGTLFSPSANFNTGTINYMTGAFTLALNPGVGGAIAVNAIDYRYLPRLSCMGLGTYERPDINREELIAFDEDYSYLYNTATQIFDVLLDPVGVFQQWTAFNSDFFWTTNYYQDTGNNYLFWATNNKANSISGLQTQDGIQIFNGTAWYAQRPVVFPAVAGPPVVPAQELRGCLILIAYKDRMIALNTLEGPAIPIGATRHPNRARWTQNGIPYTTTIPGFEIDAWRQDIIGRGGYIDAPTREAIVSCALIRDTLVVFFERSTWQLTYTGEVLLPFVWNRINEELGSESTFSSVIFDQGIFAISEKGVIEANSNGVQRVDEKIPTIAFEIENKDEGPARVHGIRDYYNKLVYWTFPYAKYYSSQDPVFPNTLLVLNYEDKNWSLFNDSFTCFGNWQGTRDITWATLTCPTWSAWAGTWNSATNDNYFPNIIAGNQKGLVFVTNKEGQLENSESLDLTTSIISANTISNTNPARVQVNNHNLQTGQYVKIKWTTGFPLVVALEPVGLPAPVGSTSFTGQIAHLGLFPSTLSIQVGALVYQDRGNGTLLETTGFVNTGTIEYETGRFTVNFAALGAVTPVTASYTYNVVNYRVFQIIKVDSQFFDLLEVLSDNTTTGLDLTGVLYPVPYTGSGVVEVLNNFDVTTKQYNPFINEAKGIRSSYYDVFLTRTPCSFIANTYVDTDDSMPAIGQVVSSDVEDGYTGSPSQLWKRIYGGVHSSFMQMEFTHSAYQMTDQKNYASDWELHGMLLDIDPQGREVNRP